MLALVYYNSQIATKKHKHRIAKEKEKIPHQRKKHLAIGRICNQSPSEETGPKTKAESTANTESFDATQKKKKN